jgi:aspartyl-tRNA(Asn)/glutamyl-tRNA(Gln) amidotransferase subunit A
LDQIGPLTKDVYDCALVLNAIAGRDPQDATSAGIETPDYTARLDGAVKGMKAGVVRELLGEGIEPAVRECILAAVKKLEELGVVCEEVSLPNSEYALPCYYIIAPAECSSNLARFDGVRYGYRCAPPYEDNVDMFSRTRGEGFGREVRLRIMLGTYALSAGYYDAYYVKALKVRTLIKQDFDRAFETHDFLLCPTSPVLPFKIGERSDDQMAMKLADVCTIPVNIAGIPAMSVPCGFVDHLPVGMQLMGKPFGEEILLRAAYAYEQAAGWVGKWPEL